MGVVTDHGQPSAGRLQGEENRGLKAIGILIFIHEHVIEAATDSCGNFRITHGVDPIKQQVVVIEHVLLLLRLDVASKELA